MDKKVLIVDDSPLLHRMYQVVLRSYGGARIEAQFALDGEEGLVKLAEHPDTDLIILDINMPTMSGLEFLRRIKKEEAFCNIAVILQSSEDKREDVERGLRAGATAYLAKPFTTEQLHALLDDVFASREGA